MRIMGIDYGDARIGIALSDALKWTAQSLEVIDCRRIKDPVARIAELVLLHDVERMVLGFPRNMNGTIGARAEKTQAFKDRLEKVIDVPIEWMDERLSTVSAQRLLIEGNVRRENRRGVVDKVAATLILQTYLDRARRDAP
ncbi:crossover junction endodeoxyribonuclease RuvA [Ferroacidibacillus organovorans]|uniref:Putative pre-16S rRNA nuclease n=2 Tax=Ferroacidibacillus organovorans TaxID=1765683 RepID=A0A101XTV6_9BACL|nr:Holliday junction resolvase RuvX [Ferroacidibacillus organovorans]KUO97361.1 crossover junction endodeoxyribonuclease RuvA [Ferroacidibacillus organovorans]